MHRFLHHSQRHHAQRRPLSSHRGSTIIVLSKSPHSISLYILGSKIPAQERRPLNSLVIREKQQVTNIVLLLPPAGGKGGGALPHPHIRASGWLPGTARARSSGSCRPCWRRSGAARWLAACPARDPSCWAAGGKKSGIELKSAWFKKREEEKFRLLETDKHQQILHRQHTNIKGWK